MKIAILVPELLVQGGGDRQAVRLTRELQEMGHEVVVYTPTYDSERCYPRVCAGLRIIITGRHPLSRLPLLSGRLKAWLDMRRLASRIEGDFDVLNPHHWPPHWAAVRAASRMSPPPAVVWMCNDPPWRPARLGGGLRRMLAPARSLSRRVFSGHDRRVVGRISKTVVLSAYAKSLIDATYGTDCDVIRSGVDVEGPAQADPSEAVDVRARHSIPAERFVVLALGILMPHRRLEDAITALSQLVMEGRDAHLLVAGSSLQHPGYVARLHTLARNLGVKERVTFAGAIAEEDLRTYYHACDSFVFPNEHQTWALAVMEAMACGRPVVVSTGAAVQEVLEDGGNALLVPPRDPDAIAGALRRLMDDAELRDRIAENGRRYVAKRFSWRRYAESMLAVFREALPAGRGESAAEERAA